MVEIRKIITTRKTIFSELGMQRCDGLCLPSAWR
jgi:hypothetical protein